MNGEVRRVKAKFVELVRSPLRSLAKPTCGPNRARTRATQLGSTGRNGPEQREELRRDRSRRSR
jgi:hypothetical protein